MTEALTPAIEAAADGLAAISDPVERYKETRKVRAELAQGDATFRAVEQRTVSEIKEGRSWREVGELLGVSGSRAEQIAKGR